MLTLCCSSGMATVFADKDWYRARPEAEEVWSGVLERNEQVVGPATRTGLDFALVTSAERLLVYSANVENIFRPLVGRRVEARGKRITMPSGIEIWLATVTPAP